MFILYVKTNGKWTEYASFKDRNGYAERVRAVAAEKKQSAKTDEVKNAAIIMEQFVLEACYYAENCGKAVLRALRHVDEVGISNDVHAALEELLDQGCDAFALAEENEDISTYTEGDFDVRI